MLEILEKGGPVLWILIGVSFVALFIIIERYLYFRKINVDENKLFLRVRQAMEQGHYTEAMAICDNALSPLATLIKKGIEFRSYPEAALKEILKDTANQEIPRLERYLTFLGSITQIAPLLGLLGTVVGIMDSFQVLGSFAGASDPAMMAKGIAEALVTTVAGILVAVPTVIFYNQLVSKVNLILLRMENQVNDLIHLVNTTMPRQRQSHGHHGGQGQTGAQGGQNPMQAGSPVQAPRQPQAPQPPQGGQGFSQGGERRQPPPQPQLAPEGIDRRIPPRQGQGGQGGQGQGGQQGNGEARRRDS